MNARSAEKLLLRKFDWNVDEEFPLILLLQSNEFLSYILRLKLISWYSYEKSLQKMSLLVNNS